MPLPTGTWKLNVNGTEADFLIDSVQEGNLAGRLFGQKAAGFWDESSQIITFMIHTGEGGGMPDIAVFKGYLFRTPATQPGGDVIATLTGSVQVPKPADFLTPNFRRNIFGWMAQIPEVQ
jgi:hypothetical protein